MTLDKTYTNLAVETADIADAPSGGTSVATAFSNGTVLANDGKTYDSVQAAQDAATSWIQVPPQTFSESVTINTNDLTVIGSGYDTLIDGGTTGDAIDVTGSNVTIRNLSVQTTAGQGNSFAGIRVQGGGCTISNVTVRDSDNKGIRLESDDNHISNSTVEDADRTAFDLGDSAFDRNVLLRNRVPNGCGNRGVRFRAHDCIVMGNLIRDVDDRGINCQGPDAVIYGNRIHNSGSDGMLLNDQSVLAVNNRVSGSATTDVQNNGNGIIRDNETDPAN